jgi:methionyl-tRNA formyltransferase
MKRVVFMGASEGGAHTLRTLLELGAYVVGIIVPKNTPSERLAEILGMDQSKNAYRINKPDRECVNWVSSLNPDLIVVNSFPYLLPKALLDIPPLGSINLHGSLLPKYRGANVLQWAIIHGETETGITMHYMDEGMDTGPVIAQKAIPIHYEDTALTLRKRIYTAGDELLREVWPHIAAGTVKATPQDEALATVYHRRKPADGEIIWNKSSKEIYDLVRALVPPWPCAFFRYMGVPFRVLSAQEKSAETEAAPGTVLSDGPEGLEVACGKGSVLLQVVSTAEGLASARDEFFKAGVSLMN